jgi:hypothetical protein
MKRGLFNRVCLLNNFTKIRRFMPVTFSEQKKYILKSAETLSVAVKILATLGEGTFGKVVKVKELNS